MTACYTTSGSGYAPASSCWSAAGVHATTTHHWRADVLGVQLRAGRADVLSPEQARSLAWWLLATVGDRTAPTDPDAVRLAIDTQRAALAARSTDDVSEDYRAALAWADHALSEIAHTAAATPEHPR